MDVVSYVFQNRLGQLAVFNSNYNPKKETIYWDFGVEYKDTVYTYVCDLWNNSLP